MKTRIVTILSDIFSSITWQHCQCDEDVSIYWRSQQVINSLITCSHNLRLIIWINFFTSSIFSSFTDFDMSLIFFIDQLWLIERVLSRRWKLCMTVFMITQCSNIFQTASNWDLLTFLTSIWTQNRIKRFVADIMYKWISLSISWRKKKAENQSEDKRIESIKIHYFTTNKYKHWWLLFLY